MGCWTSAELAAAHRIPSPLLPPAARDAASSAATATAAEPFNEQQPSARRSQPNDAARPACGPPPPPTAASVRQPADGIKRSLWRIVCQHESSFSIQLPTEFPPQRILHRRPRPLHRHQQHLREVVERGRLVVRRPPRTSSIRKPTRLARFQGSNGDETSLLLQRRDDGVDDKAALPDGDQLPPDAPEHPPAAEQSGQPQQRALPTKEPDQEAEDDLPLQVWRVWDPGGSVH